MDYRFATSSDLPLLAEWNHQLIRDEGHRNAMNVAELQDRMREFLEKEYQAVLFLRENTPISYALFRESDTEIYLRQFFVTREFRRQGLGRLALSLLFEKIWDPGKRLTLEVLTTNHAGIKFWHAVGYSDYCLTMEIMPGNRSLQHDSKRVRKMDSSSD